MFDWIPNIHPIVVHFPIALLITAVAANVVMVILKREPSPTVSWLYVLGTLGLVAAYFSGRAAVDSVLLPAPAQSIQTDHADWALKTLIAFAIVAIARLVLLRLGKLSATAVGALSAAGGIVGLVLITLTGDLGGRMVFQHGVGVAAPAPMESTREELTAVEREAPAAILGYNLRSVSGDLSSTVLPADSTTLSLYLDHEDLSFVTSETYGAVQVEMDLNVDRFKGKSSVLYGFVSKDQTDFIEFGQGTVEQGRRASGSSETFAEKVMTPTGWFTLTAVSDGSHFRGYVNGQLVVHGHGDPSSDGSVGLDFDGTGLVQIRRLSIQSLR